MSDVQPDILYPNKLDRWGWVVERLIQTDHVEAALLVSIAAEKDLVGEDKQAAVHWELAIRKSILDNNIDTAKNSEKGD